MLDRPADPVPDVPQPRRGRRATDEPVNTADDALTVHALLAVLRRRRWMFLGCALLIPLCALLIIRQATPRYTASGMLLYEPSEYKAREMQSILQADPTTEAVMASQAEILHSLHIAERVATQINLFSNPKFDAALRPPGIARRVFNRVSAWLGADVTPPHDIMGPSPDDNRTNTLLAVQGALEAHTVKFSRVLEVSFTAQDRLVAAAAANQAMDVYIKDQYAAKYKALETATGWLRQRAEELRRDVLAGEDRIAAYNARQGLSQGMHGGLDAEQISHLSEALGTARNELANAVGKLDAARGRAGATALAEVAPSVVQLRTQLDQFVAQSQAQQGRLGPNHPEARGMQQQIAEMRRSVAAEAGRVVAATEAEVRTARERVAALEQDLRDAQKTADHSAQAQVALDAMKREVAASRQSLEGVLDRMQQTVQQAVIQTTEAHEISQALPPSSPSWPRIVPMLIVAGAFGVFAGLLLVYVLELADTTLRSGENARTALGLPCFALLPEMPRRRHSQLSIDEYVSRKPMSPFAEQLRALRAGLWLGPERPRVIAVTAARPEEGKTTVTLALGRSAALSGEHVLVLECDLRHPAFGQRLHASVPAGLADCLRGGTEVHTVIQRDELSGMDVIQAGRIGTDVPDLFLSNTMSRLLTDLRQDYDLILLDAPPVQAMTEARIVAGIADATLLCVRWCVTPRAVLQHALELLEEAHAHVVGSVLTRVDARAHVRSGHADADVYHRHRRRRARE